MWDMLRDFSLFIRLVSSSILGGNYLVQDK